ncbi:hypothetical protein [Candidatus Soleaferrea massiliensis]|uniref:hypothetical protein n=1 Tax=Candidatus Soleaferrea massiliensis TaxID=1470354 RepID=UPI00058DB3DF|nr:hypothetical protein [Candidatus Soleaferrea massiliensis]
MAKPEVRLERFEEITLFGLWGRSNDRTISRDISELAAVYHLKTNTKDTEILPFFVLSRNYDARSGDAGLYMGGLARKDALEKLILPEGGYTVMTIRPKHKAFWGMAVRAAKRYFYTKWLPLSGYRAENMEYEYHTVKSIGKKPSVDLVFAVEKRVS